MGNIVYMDILIKSAKIVNRGLPELHLKKRDILIEKGVIKRIAAKIEDDHSYRVISGKNLHVSLGWFDSSVSFGEPGFEERETLANGLIVAAKSGFSHIALNPNSFPVPDTATDIAYLKNAANGHVTRVLPMGSLTMASDGEHLAELFDMHQAGAVGFYDFKRPIANPNLLKIALQYVANFQGLIFSFPQDLGIAGKGVVNEGVVSTGLGLKGIPAMAEEIQLARDLAVLEYAGGRLHVPTISTERSVALIKQAKKKGLDVSCSVAVHQLFFTDKRLESFDSDTKVLPPLRTAKHVKALKKGVLDGTIDFVTSDHIPMNIEEKAVEFDNAAFGTIGLESAFGALNMTLGMETTVDLLTLGRERFGGNTPEMTEGSPACLTLFNPDIEYEFTREYIQSASKNSMFLGAKLRGRALGTINNGMLVETPR